jgi:Fe-S-cluster containining protein
MKPEYEELQKIYNDLAEELEKNNFKCKACGKCCDFEAFDHMLYASELEVDFFIEKIKEKEITPLQKKEGRCPFHDGEKCHSHQMRALGCRVFFCCSKDSDLLTEKDALKLEDISIKYHRRLQQIHLKYNLEWKYQPFPDQVRKKLNIN